MTMTVKCCVSDSDDDDDGDDEMYTIKYNDNFNNKNTYLRDTRGITGNNEKKT